MSQLDTPTAQDRSAVPHYLVRTAQLSAVTGIFFALLFAYIAVNGFGLGWAALMGYVLLGYIGFQLIVIALFIKRRSYKRWRRIAVWVYLMSPSIALLVLVLAASLPVID